MMNFHENDERSLSRPRSRDGSSSLSPDKDSADHGARTRSSTVFFNLQNPVINNQLSNKSQGEFLARKSVALGKDHNAFLNEILKTQCNDCDSDPSHSESDAAIRVMNLDGRKITFERKSGKRKSIIAIEENPPEKPKKQQTTATTMWGKLRGLNKIAMVVNENTDDAKLYGLQANIHDEDLTTYHAKSITQVNKIKPWYVIHPEVLWKIWFDSIASLALIYCITVLPVRIAFEDKNTSLDIIDIIIDCIFGLDMLFNFFEAYEDEQGDLILDPHKIQMRYLTGWFFVDFMATFPFSLVLGQRSSAAKMSRFLRAPRLFRLFRLLRILKLVKMLNLTAFFHRLEDNSDIHPGVFRILKLIFWVILVSHASSCVWLAIPVLEQSGGSWLSEKLGQSDITFEEQSSFSKYLVAMYWSMTCLTTVGFGDIVPATNWERFFTLCMMVLGVTFYAYSTATVASVLHSLDLRETVAREKMESLRAFMQGVGLPQELMVKLSSHFRYAWWNQHSVFDTQSLMDSMPSHLRTEVAVVLYKDLIGKTPFFKSQPAQFIAAVITNIHPILYAKSAYIGIAGENVQDWYINKSGVFECLYHGSDTVLMTFVAGTTFGEIGILLTKQWQVDVRAATECEVLAMTRRSMFKVFSEFPNAREHLLNITKVRLDRLRKRMSKQGLQTDELEEPPSPTSRKLSESIRKSNLDIPCPADREFNECQSRIDGLESDISNIQHKLTMILELLKADPRDAELAYL